MPALDFDVAIVGAGPAGLSAALILGRCRHTVLVCDHGQPRNAVARGVHGFLGHDGISPTVLRAQGRAQARAYGVKFLDHEVVNACPRANNNGVSTGFELSFHDGGPVTARKLLLATGTVDLLPEIPNLRLFYEHGVHHCPYCDGWENWDRRLVALGRSDSAAKLSLELLAWSGQTTACTHGTAMDGETRESLHRNGVGLRTERILRLEGGDGRLQRIIFDAAPALECDAIFFSADQMQRSKLATTLGCECDEDGLLKCEGRQGSGISGLFLAGDAVGDVQFSIVAAADGAKAATAIHTELHEENRAARGKRINVE